jgi:lysophospholipase L1-like esterase
MTEKTKGSHARYLALGDSYTIGEAVDPSERWPVQLARLLRDEGFDIGEPAIVAKTGWTTDELLDAADHAGLKGPYELVSLLIGVNNQYRGRNADEYRPEFVALLQRAIAFAEDEPSRVLVLSIPDWSVTPFAEGRDRASISTSIDKFNDVSRQEAERLHVAYIDVTPASREALHNHSLLANDGLHPSARMYDAWAHLALPSAQRALQGL